MKGQHRGFTLSEIVIIVIVMGIVAAIVVPQFTNASSEARGNSVRGTLEQVRGQLDLFRTQHEGRAPGLVGMWGLLTGPSDTAEVQVAAGAGHAFGPYLSKAPVNPLNGLTAVSGTTGADPLAGWYYGSAGGTYTFQARDESGQRVTGY
jgi:general secretion pathway protein G